MNDDEIRHDELADRAYFEEETYSKGLSREDTLEKQFRIIMYHYSKGLWHEFEYSLKIILPFLPKVVRTQFKPLKHDVSIEGIEQHYEQLLKMCEKIESDTNMIWKMKKITTFE
jgi:hypothetical protein